MAQAEKWAAKNSNFATNRLGTNIPPHSIAQHS